MTATLSPPRSFVGDRVTAELKLVVDVTRVDPETITPVPAFRPFRPVGAIRVDRVELGDTTVLRYRYPLQCIDRACAPHAAETTIELPLGLISYTPREGDVVTLPLTWPAVEVVSRLPEQVRTDAISSPGVVTADPELDALPPLRLRGGSELLGWLMVGAAAAIVLTLGAWLFLRARPRRAEVPEASVQPAQTPLEAVLARLDEALAAGGEEERRVVLDRLGRELVAQEEPDLAREARILAWSQRGPVPERVTALTRTVRERGSPA
jgi:hypothetical protein